MWIPRGTADTVTNGEMSSRSFSFSPRFEIRIPVLFPSLKDRDNFGTRAMYKKKGSILEYFSLFFVHSDQANQEIGYPEISPN